MIMIISANGRVPSALELSRIVDIFDVNDWHHLALGTGPNGDSNFVDANHEAFAAKVHSAVLKIIEQMKDEAVARALRELHQERG